MLIPDPTQYHDGIVYLRDLHKLILKNCVELERLLKSAEQEGLFPSFSQHKEWSDLLTFFTKACPHHEQDEERYLFPLIMEKLPRIGFQAENSPIRFLIEGHEVLQNRMEPIVKTWADYRKHAHDIEALKAAAASHQEDDRQFIQGARELIELYRKHIALEEERVYSVGEKLLSPTERHQVMLSLRREYDNEAVTKAPQFDYPQFSNPNYQVRYVQGGGGSGEGDDAIDAEYEEDK